MSTRNDQYNPLLKSYVDSERVNAVSEGAECLYVRLIAQSDDAGRYYADPAWVLAKLLTARMLNGMTEKKVQGYLDELARVDLIRFYEVEGKQYLELVDVFKTFRKDVKRKYLFPQPLTAPEPNTLRTRNESVTNAGRTRDARPDQTRPIPDQTKPEHLPNANASGERVTFADFWEVYPRQTGKLKAERQWVLATRKTPAAEILDAAKEFAGSPAGNAGQYTPHPATWLYQGRWADDRATWQTANSETKGKRNAEALDLSGLEAIDAERNRGAR